MRDDDAAAEAALEELLRRMTPPDLTHVTPLRRDCLPRAITPEEAFVAWRLGLPGPTDARRAAASALRRLDALGPADPARARLRGYLAEAAEPLERGA